MNGNWKELFLTICQDMQQPISYIPKAMLTGAIVTLCMGLCSKIFGCQAKLNRKKMCLWFFCASYTVILLNVVFFSREPGSRTGIDLTLLGTWEGTIQSHGFVIENILLFIPVGTLISCVFHPMKNGLACILTGCMFSIGIELTQLVMKIGYCQLDDVVMNTIGTGLGWSFYRILLFFKGLF